MVFPRKDSAAHSMRQKDLPVDDLQVVRAVSDFKLEAVLDACKSWVGYDNLARGIQSSA